LEEDKLTAEQVSLLLDYYDELEESSELELVYKCSMNVYVYGICHNVLGYVVGPCLGSNE